MAIVFSGVPGAFFNRFGKLGLLLQQLGTYQTAQYANITNVVNGVVAQYNAEPDIQGDIGTAYIGGLNAAGSIGVAASQLAADTVNRMVFRDNPRVGQTLQNLNVNASIAEVIRQMKQQGVTVLAMTIGSSIQPFTAFNTNVGNGIVNVSTKRPPDGLVVENAYQEQLQLICSRDSYIGGATQGNEQFTVTGAGIETAGPFAFDWPLGSGCQIGLAAIDGNSNNSSGNVLTNSNWLTWSGGLPSQYSNFTGSSLLSQNGSILYDGSSALLITGDGATLASFQQLFNSAASGTGAKLLPLTAYSFNVFLRRGGAAVTGKLAFSLVNSGGAVINDAAGNSNILTVDLSTLTTNYTSYTAVFMTPLVLPSSYYFKVNNPAGFPVSNGGQVYAAKASLGQMSNCYVSGPYLAVHAGSTPFNQGDYAFTNITNSRGAAGTLNTFQTAFARLLFQYVYPNGFLLPSSLAPTIPDSLIA